MFPIPDKYFMVTGTGEGDSPLTAFDAALLAAGLGNYNLVKMSSIMPPRARPSGSLHEDVPPGSLLPVAYGFITCDVPGQVISAAVAAGLTDDPASYGVIMEHKGPLPAADVERQVAAMTREALGRRGLPVREVLVAGTEHTVVKIGCAFAAIAIWK